jgi:hypothetical protein
MNVPGGDVVARVETELQLMLAFHPAQVVHKLINTLDGRLGRIPVGAEVDVEIVLNLDVREHIEPRKIDNYRLKAGRILWRLKVALRLKPSEACSG